MKLERIVNIHGQGIPWVWIYPVFLIHMLAFGGSGFYMAYSEDGPPIGLLYLHGGFALYMYSIFYVNMFGREEVKWMLINAALGLFGIYTEMSWLLSLFGTTLSSYPVYVHVIPFLYYVMYTFLLRQAALDLTASRTDAAKRKIVERYYVGISLLVYTVLYLLTR